MFYQANKVSNQEQESRGTSCFSRFVRGGVPSVKDNIYKYVQLCVYRGSMNSKNITLKVKSDTYDDYRKYCKKKGLIVSRQFEILMEKELEENGK